MRGVYKIENLVNGNMYVGSTMKSFSERFRKHRNQLRNGNHFNIHLQRAWNKYGEQNFKFEIVEVIDNPTREILIERETHFAESLNASYNLTKIDRPGSHNLGKKYGPKPDAIKEKISEARKGKCVGIDNPVYKGMFIFYHPFHGTEVTHQWGMVQKYGLTAYKMSLLCSGKRQSHAGWICKGKAQ